MRRFLFVAILAICSTVHAGAFREVPRKYRRAVEAIESLPEARALLKKVEAEGPVSLAPGRGSFDGCWEGGSKRRITVATARSEGAIIGTVLFELSNAASEKALQGLIDKAATGELSKEGYVEGVERIEHQSAIRTCELIDCGIERGIFPLDARLYVLPDFEDHYRLQQWAGHSDWIAAHFDRMFPARGWAIPL